MRKLATSNSFVSAVASEGAAAGEDVYQPTLGKPLSVSVDRISPNPSQPRTIFDETAMAELAASISKDGVLQPVIAMPNPDKPGHYWLVAGERRLRASVMAGLETVPVIVRENVSEAQMARFALIENLHRADLQPMEKARAYRAIMDEQGLTQVRLAEELGVSRSSLANTLRLLDAEPAVQQALEQGQISEAHALELMTISDDAEQVAMLATTVNEGLSRAKLHERIKAKPSKAPPPITTADLPVINSVTIDNWQPSISVDPIYLKYEIAVMALREIAMQGNETAKQALEALGEATE